MTSEGALPSWQTPTFLGAALPHSLCFSGPEHKEAPDSDAPFYQAEVVPVHFQQYQYQPTELVLSSSYPAYQPAYPSWYQPAQLPQVSNMTRLAMTVAQSSTNSIEVNQQ